MGGREWRMLMAAGDSKNDVWFVLLLLLLPRRGRGRITRSVADLGHGLAVLRDGVFRGRDRASVQFLHHLEAIGAGTGQSEAKPRWNVWPLNRGVLAVEFGHTDRFDGCDF